jgi:hypothetical protein
MKRLSLLLLFLVALSAAAKKSGLPAELLQAKSVVVTVYPESGNTVASSFNRPPIGEDLRVIREVETAIKGWGRWKVVSTMNEADLVIAVRKGRIGTASVEFPVPPPNGESKEVSLTAETGSPEDVIAIYSAGTVVDTGSNRHNFDAPIWRRVQANALEAPYMQGIQQLRREIEKAEANSKK